MGRFDQNCTCFGDLGRPVFSKDGPHMICTRSPLKIVQTLSLIVRDLGVFFLQSMCDITLLFGNDLLALIIRFLHRIRPPREPGLLMEHYSSW